MRITVFAPADIGGTGQRISGLLIGVRRGTLSSQLASPVRLSSGSGIMSQQSEDRVDESAREPVAPPSARILPFERPQSDLQRAVQLRAQEAMDLDRDRDREANKPAPLRWLVILLIAAIPVILIFAAVDAFLRVFHKVNETYSTMPAPQQEEPGSDASPLVSSQPGVVLLQPLEAAAPKETPADNQKPASDARPAPEGE